MNACFAAVVSAVVSALTLVSAPVLANDDAILSCRSVSEDGARLRCYDAIRVAGAPRTGATAAMPAAAAATPVAAYAPTRQQQEQSFGLEVIKLSERIDHIDSHIVGNFDGWGPGHVFRLANGQSWRVVDGSEGVTREMVDPAVRVVRGALGAMYLEIDGTNRSPKVQRVQ